MVLWKDGSTGWIRLKDVKDSNPVEVAEYAVANRLQDDPEFSWWVSKVLRRWNVIISKVNSNYLMMKHNFGIRLPNTVEEALSIDNEAGNDYWWNARSKEMGKVKFLWQRVDGVTPDIAISGSVKDIIGHQEINCQIIFDVRMDFQRKARFLAGCHMIEAKIVSRIPAWYPVILFVLVNY